MRLRYTPLFLAASVACQSAEPVETLAPSETVPTTLETSEPIVAKTAVEASAPTSQAGQDTAENLRLRQQRREALAAEYIERGDAELERADLEAAMQSYSAALEVDPSNETARTQLRRVQALLGDEFQSVAEAIADETDRAMVRRAQALLEVGQFSEEGDRALREARYDDAVASYRQALTILRWHPMIATESLDERIVTGKIEEAERLRDEAAEAAAVANAEAARRQAEEIEQAERERRERKLQEFYQRANEAFVADRFEEAERWCALILIKDPGNEAAKNLQTTARAARHSKADEDIRRQYREQWLRTFEELDTMNVLQTDALVFDERWRQVRQRTPLTHGDIDPGSSEERAAVLAKLASVPITPKFGGPDNEGSPLTEVAAFLQGLTGINFWISTAVRDELDEEETSIVLNLPERSVLKVLEIIAETSESLRWKIEDGVVKFVTETEMTGGQHLVTYSVQDIIHPIPDYPGREINISPSGGIIPPDEDIEEREANVVTSSLLEDLIRNNVEPESWDADPANSIRITEMGQLVVNQAPEVHEKIQHLLDDLREATGIMVDIQARFMKVEDNFLEDIGVDFRGLGQPGLGVNGEDFNDFGDASTQNDLGQEIGQGSDVGAFYDEGNDGAVRARVEELYDLSLGNDQVLQGSGGFSFQWTFLNDLQLELILRAVSKSERVELVTAPRILVHNTARANLAVLNQVAYVQDFDVEIAQGASIADPIIAVIQDGVVLDVRPVVSADRRFITLELRPTIAELQRPIAEKITTLGSQNSVTIQLPEIEIQRVRTSIPIPDGGTVLLGGTKVSEKKSNASGVPILNKIPLLSTLFERQGNFVSNRKLLILLRANIVIPEEREPSAAELGLTD